MAYPTIKHVTTLVLTVYSYSLDIDVNTPRLLHRVLSSNEKTVCCLLLSSGPISLTVSTDGSGYCSGESIHINSQWHGLFRSLVLSRLPPKTYRTEKIIKTIESSVDTQNMLLPIPLTAPTITSSTCSGIQIFYTLDVLLVLHNAWDLHVELPVVVGTIPFRGPNANGPALERNNLIYAPVSTKQVYIGCDAYTQGDLYYTPLYGCVDNAASH